MQPLKATCGLIASLLVAGCAAVDRSPYPEVWGAAVELGSGCRGINGIYNAYPERHTHRNPNQESLLALTLLPADAGTVRARTVSMEITESGALRVAAYAEDGSVLSGQTYSPGDGIFDCDNGELVFDPPKVPNRQHAPDNPVVGVSWGDVGFRRTADNSLVMRVSDGVTGMAFLLIPVYVEIENWYLFKRVSQSN